MTAQSTYEYNLPWAGTPGASAEAIKVDKQRSRDLYRIKGRLSETSALRNELFTLAHESRDISEATLSKAYQFAIALPSDIVQPELSVDPDGEIAFDWANDDSILSISVGGAGRIVYAGKFAETTTSGTIYFSDRIPASLRNALKKFRKQ